MARFQPASDDSLLVYFDESSNPLWTSDAAPEVRNSALKLLHLLESQPISGVRNLHPAYNSILLRFDAVKLTHSDLQSKLHHYLGRLHSIELPEARLIQVPVCYGDVFGPDLAELASLHNLSSEQVIGAHSSVTYSVAFLGFIPGFAYLSGLPQELATPRLTAPRRQVPAGSVGIAGNQTGVYPFSTPGGWRLIGRTPLQMFRADREPMSVLAIGDFVRFNPISREQFGEMASE